MSSLNILALVPARGGSKGLSRKNLCPVLDKPLLQYTLDEAKKSEFITELMMSSEDQEINDFAKTLNVNVNYVRPQYLAEDETTTVQTVLHFLDWIEKNSQLPDLLVLLQPTSPLRTSQQIDEAIKQFIASDKSSLLSVQKMKEHPYKCIKKSAESWDYLTQPTSYVSRRQDYDDSFYVINGAIYIVSPKYLRKNGKFTTGGDSELFIMDPVSGIDIDDIADVFQVESLLKMRKMQLA